MVRANAVANRERILVAAEAVFGEHGAAGSTEDVAARAGVGIATVFRHFPTKSALIEAALIRHFEVLNRQTSELAACSDAGSSLRALIRTMIETGSTKLTLASMLADGVSSPTLRDAADSLRSKVRDVLTRAAVAGTIRQDVTVDEVYLLVRGLAQACATTTTPRRTLDGAINIILAGLGD